MSGEIMASALNKKTHK